MSGCSSATDSGTSAEGGAGGQYGDDDVQGEWGPAAEHLMEPNGQHTALQRRPASGNESRFYLLQNYATSCINCT